MPWMPLAVCFASAAGETETLLVQGRGSAGDALKATRD
jgi:hypothetical protein